MSGIFDWKIIMSEAQIKKHRVKFKHFKNLNPLLLSKTNNYSVYISLKTEIRLSFQQYYVSVFSLHVRRHKQIPEKK